ncbi:MAG: substrate-binding domain-containing protein [Prevotellaceae bacterium]|nr:substrate-binding domain-containing protein [Prevotellaceae bacterium]
MRLIRFCFIIFGCAVIFLSCGDGKKSPYRKDSKGNTVPVEDYVCVAIDETFQPIFEVLVKDFRDRNAKAFTDPLFMPEDDAVKMLLADSVRSIVITRSLKTEEKDYLFAKHNLKTKEGIVAFDAITLIANLENKDTLISVDEIKKIVEGKITDWSRLKHNNGQSGEIEIVFDNNGSSTVRYMQDSLCAGGKLKGKLRAAKTHEELINYVKHKKNTIGVLGVDWVGNPNDSTRLSFLSDIRIMKVAAEYSSDPDDYYLPYQFYISTGSYPLTRCLYIITTDPRVRSLEKHFFYYITDNPNHNNMGQMMILKFSQLLPYMAVQSHNVVIKRY